MSIKNATIEHYICYFHRLMIGAEVDSITPESLLKFALIYPAGSQIVKDQFEEQMIAQKALKKIMDGESPFFKYDSDTDTIYKLKLVAKKVR